MAGTVERAHGGEAAVDTGTSAVAGPGVAAVGLPVRFRKTPRSGREKPHHSWRATRKSHPTRRARVAFDFFF